jgi:hypothetical protein
MGHAHIMVADEPNCRGFALEEDQGGEDFNEWRGRIFGKPDKVFSEAAIPRPAAHQDEFQRVFCEPSRRGGQRRFSPWRTVSASGHLAMTDGLHIFQVMEKRPEIPLRRRQQGHGQRRPAGTGGLRLPQPGAQGHGHSLRPPEGHRLPLLHRGRPFHFHRRHDHSRSQVEDSQEAENQVNGDRSSTPRGSSPRARNTTRWSTSGPRQPTTWPTR